MITGIPRLIVLGVTFLLLQATSTSSSGAENAAPAPEAASQEKPAKAAVARPYPFSGKIASLDKKSMTLTLEGKEKTRVIAVTSQTKFTKQNKPAVFDDITVGEEVGGQLTKNAEGKEEAVSLRIGAKVPVAAKTK